MASLISVKCFQNVCLLLYSVSEVLCYHAPRDHQTPELPSYMGLNYSLSDISHIRGSNEQLRSVSGDVKPNPCHPSPCEANSQCRNVNGQPVCSCLTGFIGSPPTCRVECTTNSDCLPDKACSNAKCINPCQGACGVEAICQVINHNPTCSCPNLFTGNPFIRCAAVPVNQESVNPCIPSPCGPNSVCKGFLGLLTCSCKAGFVGSPPYCKPECISNSECPTHQGCINQKCVDPCISSCGENSQCHVVNHYPSCSCLSGFTGVPLFGCHGITPEQEVASPCQPSPCGGNSICKEQNGAGSCTCLADYFGNPYIGCRPECSMNTDCPSNKACLENKCRDPCIGACGIGALCLAVNHSPRCSCPPPFAGNPLHGCAVVALDPVTRSDPVPRLGASYAPSLQWHVGIYTKTFSPYKQICGGSLVKTDVVLSAAHCFWKDDVGALRPALFAVAAGKLLRPWHTSVEDLAQYSDVKIIKIPLRFYGVKTSFQEDMAIVMTSDPFEFGPGVMPVCINFDLALDRSQLESGNMGKIAGWGLTEPNGPPSQRLNFLELPYVDIEQCIRTAEPSFLRYITSDKICAGDQKSGRALCRGDSGGGLVFEEAGVPYLRGIASTAPRDRNECNAYAVASFTHVRAHMTFLVEHVPDIAEGCEELYGKTIEGNASEFFSLRQGEQSGGQTKVVTMNVESGGQRMVAVPMDHNVNTIVFNVFCKEHGTK